MFEYKIETKLKLWKYFIEISQKIILVLIILFYMYKDMNNTGISSLESQMFLQTSLAHFISNLLTFLFNVCNHHLLYNLKVRYFAAECWVAEL